MFKPKKIISLLLIFSVFVSNVGLILKYDCCFDNAEIVFNVFNENDCCEMPNVLEDIVKEDDCCSAEINTPSYTSSEDHNCNGHCFTSNEYKKLDVEIISFKIEKINHFFEEINCDLSREINFENKQYLRRLIINDLPDQNFGKKFLITNHKIKIPFPLLYTA